MCSKAFNFSGSGFTSSDVNNILQNLISDLPKLHFSGFNIRFAFRTAASITFKRVSLCSIVLVAITRSSCIRKTFWLCPNTGLNAHLIQTGQAGHV